MTRSPVRRPGVVARPSSVPSTPPEGVDSGASSSTLEVDFGAAPPWSAWELMPTDVLLALERAGVQPMLPYVTGAKEPRVRKRGDDFLERAHGWAVDRRALILLDAVRGVERVVDGKFRPAGPWRLTVRQRPFIGEVKELSGTVPVDVNVGTGANLQEASSQAWVDVIDVLPAPVRKQVHTTVANPEIDFDTLTQGYDKGVPSDHEAGLVRVAAGHMIALTATRRIPVSRRMSPGTAEALLAEAPWDVTTVTARLGPAQVTELSAHRSEPLAVSDQSRNAAPAAAIDPAQRD